jgi:hypothetical protein
MWLVNCLGNLNEFTLKKLKLKILIAIRENSFLTSLIGHNMKTQILFNSNSEIFKKPSIYKPSLFDWLSEKLY